MKTVRSGACSKRTRIRMREKRQPVKSSTHLHLVSLSPNITGPLNIGVQSVYIILPASLKSMMKSEESESRIKLPKLKSSGKVATFRTDRTVADKIKNTFVRNNDNISMQEMHKVDREVDSLRKSYNQVLNQARVRSIDIMTERGRAKLGRQLQGDILSECQTLQKRRSALAQELQSLVEKIQYQLMDLEGMKIRQKTLYDDSTLLKNRLMAKESLLERLKEKNENLVVDNTALVNHRNYLKLMEHKSQAADKDEVAQLRKLYSENMKNFASTERFNRQEMLRLKYKREEEVELDKIYEIKQASKYLSSFLAHKFWACLVSAKVKRIQLSYGDEESHFLQIKEATGIVDPILLAQRFFNINDTYVATLQSIQSKQANINQLKRLTQDLKSRFERRQKEIFEEQEETLRTCELRRLGEVKRLRLVENKEAKIEMAKGKLIMIGEWLDMKLASLATVLRFDDQYLCTEQPIGQRLGRLTALLREHLLGRN